MIEVTPSISLNEKELEYQFIRASGPGGQNVNKTSTAVQLRFNVYRSASLPPDVRTRLIRLCGRRLTNEGEMVIEARRQRSQEQNRKDALERLVELIRRAAHRPKIRRKTKPTRAAKEKRIKTKQIRGTTKQRRRAAFGADD
ncbi:MAG: aminoacyl-tRNA hydrolase [Spirochaetia bacterium]|nr:aminoacyl-tRNA hydrolase [Spirochaetia bacterium]